jgi:hypothetical protein
MTGLGGRMTKTIEGAWFVTVMMPDIIGRIGPYPHAALRQIRHLDRPKGSRLIRVTCAQCGYKMRVARRWLQVATPLCPNFDCPDFGQQMEIG